MRVFFTDTETATLKGPILDLALIEIDEQLEVIRTYEALVDPVVRIAPAAQAVHGITQARVADEPTMVELIARDGYFFPMDEPIIVIGHNVQFDIRMFQAENVMPEQHTKVCTLKMARNMWPDIDMERENHKLGTLAIMFGLETGPAHRAMGDCVTGLNLLRHMADVSGVQSFEELLALGKRDLSPESKLGFGAKHKDTKIKDVPKDYIRWMLSNVKDLDPDLKAAISARLQ